MARFFKNRSEKVGLPPGSFRDVKKAGEEPLRICLFNYTEGILEEKNGVTLEEALAYSDQSSIAWINMDGVHHADAVQKLCTHFGIHPLTIEDILSTDHRPKLEESDDYIFLVLKTLEIEAGQGDVITEQVSMVLGKNFVLSFQERRGDTFDPVRERLRAGKGRIRKVGADYLLYTLIDTIIDYYYVILENIGDRLEAIEEDLLTDANGDSLNTLYRLKKEMAVVRRSVWPLREVVNKLERDELKLIKKDTRIFFRDVYDHTIQVIDTVETYRDMLSSMVDLYQSTISNKMNAVMKVLTIISTIFIPLTFIAGIYGMNFDYIPELNWHYGYFAVWAIMLALALMMIYLFRRKKWL